MVQKSAAQIAFDDALDLVRSKYPDSPIQTWLKDKYSPNDVQEAIEKARSHYESRSKSKTREWLVKISDGIMYYGEVMDMLVQHHPEYVSLAWGTTKFLFILFQNHDELVTELARTLSEIADMLPRTQRFLSMYSDDDILQEKAEQFFALLIEHLHEMLRFYQEGRAKHIWHSLIKPYKLRFLKRKEEINACSRAIDQHVMVLLHHGLNETRRDVALMQRDIASLLLVMSQIQGNTALLPSMAFSQRRIEYSSMVDKASNDGLQQPEDALQLRMAYFRRHVARVHSRVLMVWTSDQLQRWSVDRGSRVLHIHGSWPSRIEMNVVSAQMVQYARSSGFTVLWALQSTDPKTRYKITWTQLLKYLTMQALQANSQKASASLCNEFHLLHAATATRDQDWEQMLFQSLIGVPLVYVVIDLELIEDDLLLPSNITPVLQSLEHLGAGRTTFKIVILNERRDRQMNSNLTNPNTLMLDGLFRRAHIGPSRRPGMAARTGLRTRGGFNVSFRPSASTVR